MEDLNKKPDRWLADEFAQAKERASTAEKLIERIKAEFKRRGKSLYKGLRYDVTAGDGGRKQLDVQSLVTEMGEAWVEARKKWMGWTEWRVRDKELNKATPSEADAAKTVEA
jgi:hypothetical protein